MSNSFHNDFMALALDRASLMLENKALDIPVCAVIVKDNKIISIKTNEKEKTNCTMAHAEMLALIEANKKLNSWRLEGCDMYVTLEPCAMCATAIMNARISNLYFSSYDIQYGAFSTSLNLKKFLNSKINVFSGIMVDRGDEILKKYFEKLRK